jgi:hypothetical protein
MRSHTLAPLTEGQVRVVIDSFALTSNNITYAAFGDAMNYWRFFPVLNEDGTEDPVWGCIPVWGFGTVQESRHPGLATGERLYGYFPMATHVDLAPARLSPNSFMDSAARRAELHPVYNQYMRCSTDPFHTADTENVQALLRPLFTTSWLIDDFMADNNYFGATAQPERAALMLLSSASSKTAYGTAFMLAKRSGIEVVGFTSERNIAFCESLGCYHRVLSYAQLGDIDADTPAVYIDFAGNASFRRAVHTHCKRLAYSSSIGGTHVKELGGGRDLPGPKPTLFFAPAQIKKRSTEWGPQVLGERLVQSWQQFVATVGDASKPWLRVRKHHGQSEVQATYLEVLAGQGDPRTGHILSL